MSTSVLKSVFGAGVIVACAAASSPASAIVINDGAGDNASATGSITLGNPFTSTVNILKGGGQACTGALISSTMILTAQHCIRDSGTQALTSTATLTVQVKGSAGALLNSVGVTAIHETDSNSTLLDGSDIAILQLASAVPGGSATPIRLLDAGGATMVGQMATLVGFGRHGVGTTGAPSSNADGQRRAATNVVDAYGAARALGCVVQGGTSNILSTDFDDGAGGNNSLSGCASDTTPLASEGTSAKGDSGGPLLWYDPVLDEYLIVGVLSGGTTPFGAESSYSDISYWTGTDFWQSFIEGFGGAFVTAGVLAEQAPEPETLVLFALALFGMAAYRRRAFNR